jgi:ectoine hydroxylase-related dioxygenase (phytanoyl-CoA dioxygenase family)
VSGRPTESERYSFETNGYLVLESFLSEERVETLRTLLRAVIDRRRAGRGTKLQVEATQANGADTRIFHLLDEDPAFVEMLDPPALVPYIEGLLNESFHFHASDAIWEEELKLEGSPGWHMDGRDAGYRGLRPHIPHLQLKVGYYLSDMSEPDQGNLMLVPGSHRTATEPSPEQLAGFDTFPGAVQICAGPGAAVLFHNAVWHTRGPHRRPGGRRILLYYAYEQPWMIGNAEHWKYPTSFYNGLSPERRKLFHGFVFDPPEMREY